MFIKLTDKDGDDCYVNVAHIIMFGVRDKGGSYILLRDQHSKYGPDYQYVKDTPFEIASKIRAAGEIR